MTMARVRDINMTTNMDVACSKRRVKNQAEQSILLLRSPGVRLLSKFTASGRCIVLEHMSIQDATMYRRVVRFSFFEWRKCIKARVFPGSPINKQIRNPVATSPSYTRNDSVSRNKSTAIVELF